MIIYLHGFCSSPESHKARQLADYLSAAGRAAEYHCPALSPFPDEAIAQAEAAIGEHPQATLVGSSMGGYYAAHLAEKHDLRAVLINPAVLSHLAKAGLVGAQRNFHSGESFEFTTAHLDQLRRLSPPAISPQRYLLLLESGDEVLDYRLSIDVYRNQQTPPRIFTGGDHSFTRFAACLAEIVAFADRPPACPPV